MKLIVNGRETEVDPQGTVLSLLSQLGLEVQPGMAVALNDSVVPRSRWAQQALQADDRVEILRAVQGG